MVARTGVRKSKGTGYRAAPDASEAYILERHRITSATKPPGVLFLGGNGTTAYTWALTTFSLQVDLVAAAGLVGLGSDQGGPSTFGNDASIAATADMWTYLTGAGGANPSKDVGIICGSMGATIACNWARQNLAKVGCIHMTIPAVDVEDIRANNRGGLQASIETAYVNNAGWQAARPTHNPIEYVAELIGIPFRIVYSTDDPICTPSTVTTFATAVDAELVSLGAVGHVGTSQDFQAANAWVLEHLDV